MTLYGYARVSVREPADKNLDLQVEQPARTSRSTWTTWLRFLCFAKLRRA